MGQGFGVGHIAFEGLVGERKSVFVKGDAHVNLATVVALLLVFSVFGLGVGRAETLEMADGDIVENDASAERKKIMLALAQGGLDVLAKGHDIVAGAVEVVLGAFGEADVEVFGSSVRCDQSMRGSMRRLKTMSWPVAMALALGFMPRASSMGVKRNSSRALRATSSGASSTTSVLSMESRITPSTVVWGSGLAA